LRIVIDGRYINDRFPGIGRYTYNLARALGGLDTKDEFLILINPRQKNSRFDFDLIADTKNMHLIPCSIPRSLPFEVFSLPVVIHRLRPSVFHAPFFLRPYAIPCPCVTTLHDVIPLRYGDNSDRIFYRPIFWIGVKLACQSSAAIVCPSKTSGEYIERFCERLGKRLFVTPLAADPLLRRQPESAIDKMRQKLGLLRPYVLHLGSHFPHKNVESLVLAWASLKSSANQHSMSHQLVLAGYNASNSPLIRKLMRKHGIEDSVNFIGTVDEEEIASLYSGADLFVFPSKIEGFGLPVIEAMACGTPVICSNAAALREIANGAAWTVDPNHIDSLAGAIDQFLASSKLRREFIKKGLDRAAQLTWEATAKETYRVYKKVSQS
jgi:glycosyltransferase involved in cell wall biosynthesis